MFISIEVMLRSRFSIALLSRDSVTDSVTDSVIQSPLSLGPLV